METAKNIMGTVSFTHKFQGLKKEQEFIVYPIKADSDLTRVFIQSDHRFAIIDLHTGKGIMTAHHAQHANSVKLSWDIANKKAVNIELDHENLFILRNAIRETAGFDVGKSIVKCDNTGAIMA